MNIYPWGIYKRFKEKKEKILFRPRKKVRLKVKIICTPFIMPALAPIDEVCLVQISGPSLQLPHRHLQLSYHRQKLCMHVWNVSLNAFLNAFILK